MMKSCLKSLSRCKLIAPHAEETKMLCDFMVSLVAALQVTGFLLFHRSTAYDSIVNRLTPNESILYLAIV